MLGCGYRKVEVAYHLPHDEFDHDSVRSRFGRFGMAGPTGQKKMRKVMMWANCNGVFCVLIA
jgi:hypothetical protein